MSVSLDYSTTDPVPPQVLAAIDGEAQQVIQGHDWWSESLNFFDLGEEDGRLCGGTKIFLTGGYSTPDGGYVEVDIEDDCLMAYRDTCFILEKLAEWSSKHGLTWQIECAGERIGIIAKGQWDRQLRDYVEEMKKLFPWPSSLEDSAKAISAKYASRW